MIVTDTMSIFDVILTTTGSIDNVYQYLIQYNIESLNEDLTNRNIDVEYSQNQYAQNNLLNKYRVSTKDRIAFTAITTGAFSNGFSGGFDI